jgi:16S rRNA (uracil1498-N3)-methyltransferase
MLPRFLLPDLDPSRSTAILGNGEAHHLTRVLRLTAGDEVAVFDGRGREYRASIERIAGGTVTLRLGEPVETPPERRTRVTLAQAVLKGAGMDDVVRDATMMGVSRIVPLVSLHTVATRAAAQHGADRWRRVAIASAKQCRRARVPDVDEPCAFEAWLRQPRDGAALLLVEPSLAGVEPSSVRDLASLEPPSTVTVVVGPEGGWAPEELQAAVSAGLRPVTLGPLTLRADAVPLAALAALTVVWD